MASSNITGSSSMAASTRSHARAAHTAAVVKVFSILSLRDLLPKVAWGLSRQIHATVAPAIYLCITDTGYGFYEIPRAQLAAILASPKRLERVRACSRYCTPLLRMCRQSRHWHTSVKDLCVQPGLLNAALPLPRGVERLGERTSERSRCCMVVYLSVCVCEHAYVCTCVDACEHASSSLSTCPHLISACAS
jgi:hypothetical protein